MQRVTVRLDAKAPVQNGHILTAKVITVIRLSGLRNDLNFYGMD